MMDVPCVRECPVSSSIALRWAVFGLLWLSACDPTDKEGSSSELGALDDAFVDGDGDGYTGDEDCNDSDASVGPGAVEVCDGVDNDCDGIVDEDVTQTYYADDDGDGFGDPDAAEQACDQPAGAVPNSNDCDDTNGDIFPGATEVCNELDDDCSGEADDGIGGIWYADSDDDGYGDPDQAIESCDPGAGWSTAAGDCDDTDPDAFPGNPEVCDEADNNCDGRVDEGLESTFYIDRDGDGWGDASLVTEACLVPTGYAEVPGDCNDLEPSINPDGVEVCNGLDDDCDSDIDEADATDVATWHYDGDGDGYGSSTTVTACDAPSGYVSASVGLDCDDADGTVNPGATEVCNDIDDDCDSAIDESDAADASTWYIDSDSDGYGTTSASTTACDQPSGYAAASTDCDDADSAVNPGASEVCNEVDDDCDGHIDDADSSVTGVTTWYADLDGDSYGDADNDLDACEAPTSYVSDDTDCDDGDSAVNPGAAEVCNGDDDDCDGTADNGVLGTGAACPAEDCAEILDDNPSATDGSYELDLGTYTCDMTTDGGGWTLVGSAAHVYGTGYTGTYYNSEGFYWDEALFTYNSGSVHAHCSYPGSLTGCNNIGMQFASESWGVAQNWGSSLCGMSTTDYTGSTTYVGTDWIIDRSASTDTIRVGTLEGIANCTTSDNPGSAYMDIWVRN